MLFFLILRGRKQRSIHRHKHKQNTTLGAYTKILVGTLKTARATLIKTMFCSRALVIAVARGLARAH